MKEELEKVSKELINKKEHLSQLNMNVKSRLE